MTIFHGLPFVFRVIMMNPGFVSSGNILEEIIPFETILVKKFLSNSFLVPSWSQSIVSGHTWRKLFSSLTFQ